MNDFEIKINIPRLLHYSESLKPDISEETLLSIIESFSFYILEVYLSLIEDAINSKRYKGNWEPVEEEVYKESLGTEPIGNIFILMKDSIESVKIGYNYHIRFNPRYRYPDSNLPLVRVLKIIEFGKSGLNSRPILKAIVRDIKRDMINLWRGYLTMRGVV